MNLLFRSKNFRETEFKEAAKLTVLFVNTISKNNLAHVGMANQLTFIISVMFL